MPAGVGMTPVRVVSFDFYQTLVRHGGDRGRGSVLVDYLVSIGFAPPPWEHDMLYRIFERHRVEYRPGGGAGRRRRYIDGLARRIFDVLGLQVPAGVAERHAVALWEILGPASLATFPDVRPALEALGQRGYRLVVISNWQSGLEHFCVELGLAPFFDAVLSSADEGVAKPDPRIFHRAASRLGVSTSEMLHVGDSPIDDYVGGSGAGCRVVLLDRAGTSTEEGRVEVRGLSELLDLLEGHDAHR